MILDDSAAGLAGCEVEYRRGPKESRIELIDCPDA